MYHRSKQPFSLSNFAFLQRALLLAAWALAVLTLATWGSVAYAAPKRPLRNIRTLYDTGGQGNPYFNAQLRREVRQAGFRFVRSRQAADASFASSGNWTQDGGFAARVTFRDRRGHVLWHRAVRRPANSRVMAFESLSRELRAAK